MTKTKKILVTLSAILAVAIVCVFSWSYGFRQGIRAGGLTSNMAEFMLVEQHMVDQMAKANCEGVKQAINDLLILLEKYRDVKGSFISETIYYGDKMYAHLRLSMIEAHMGNEEAASKHMERAREACTNRKWENCSDENLISFAERLEEMSPIACLTHDKKNTAQHANSSER